MTTTMVLFPKIDTVFDRDEKTFRVIKERLRCPEYRLITEWKITEKVDGTNVRVGWMAGDERHVEFGGRTDAAQMPTFLLKYLQDTFTPERMARVFTDLEPETSPVLFGEGYGLKIQSGGNYRTEGVAFRLIDVKVGRWWLKEEVIAEVATKLGVKIMPPLGRMTLAEAVALVEEGSLASVVSQEEAAKHHLAEGIVARTDPMLFDRAGNRLMWKLKARDFRHGKVRW